MTATPETLSVEAESVFGRMLTPSIAMGEWPSDERAVSGIELAEDPLVEARLRAALSIARMLLEVEASDTVQAWFAGKNPIPGDRVLADTGVGGGAGDGAVRSSRSRGVWLMPDFIPTSLLDAPSVGVGSS